MKADYSPSDLAIRPAERDDLQQIWDLVLALADYERLLSSVTGTILDLEHWLFDDPVVECLVAEQADRIVGYALFFRSFSTFKVKPGIWLEDLFVLPDLRGNGIGKSLISAVIETAKANGYGRVEWSVLDWNESAIGFYEKLGATVMPDWRTCRVSL